MAAKLPQRIWLRSGFHPIERGLLLERQRAAPGAWRGGAWAARVRLDAGGEFWVPAGWIVALDRADVYERARPDPLGSFDAALRRSPQDLVRQIGALAGHAAYRYSHRAQLAGVPGDPGSISLDHGGIVLYGLLRGVERRAAIDALARWLGALLDGGSAITDFHGEIPPEDDYFFPTRKHEQSWGPSRFNGDVAKVALWTCLLLALIDDGGAELDAAERARMRALGERMRGESYNMGSRYEATGALDRYATAARLETEDSWRWWSPPEKTGRDLGFDSDLLVIESG